MPRKGPATKRQLVTDPVYGSPLVTALVNKVLVSGKRSLADVYRRMSAVSRSQPPEPDFWSTFRSSLRSNLLGR